jgi:hypothetical protein
MPSGDPVPSREGQPSDAASQAPAKPPTKTAITPKSAAITARTNYVSPYRQQPRSASTPVVKPNPENPNAGNFKNFVTKFNKPEEKVPVPTNRIPADAASANVLKSKGSQTYKANGVVDNNGKRPSSKPRSSSTASVRGAKQPPTSAAKGINSAASGTRSAAGSRQSRLRRLSTSSTASDAPVNNRLLPPLQTSFSKGGKAKGKGHRRSRSMEAPSPSAASMADNESDASQPQSERRPLTHRRSRSDMGFSASPDHDVKIDHDLLREYPGDTPISPHSVRLGASFVDSPTSGIKPLSSSAQPKKRNIAPPLASPHGSRHRSPAPSKSPQMKAYITSPPPKTSPNLRSSRGQRLPAAANTTTHASRQRLQPATKDPRVKGRVSLAEEGKRKDPKKKIPELGTIDFAARRARIQNAFTQSLKESNEREQLRADSGRKESSGEDTRKGGVAHAPIEEENEEEDKGSGPGGDTDVDLMAEQIMAHIPAPIELEDTVPDVAPTAEENSKQVDTALEEHQDQIPVPAVEQTQDQDAMEDGRHEDEVPVHQEEIQVPQVEEVEEVLPQAEEVQESQIEARPHQWLEVEQSFPGAWDTANDSDYLTEVTEIVESPVNECQLDIQQEQEQAIEALDDVPDLNSNNHHDEPIVVVKEEPSEEDEPPRLPTRFSQFFMPEQYPYTAKKNRRSPASSNRTSANAPISVVVTPDSPTQPLGAFSQVSDILRTNSVAWTTDSELSGSDSPVLHARSNNIPAPVNQRDAATRFDTKFESAAHEEPKTPTASPMVSSATSDDRRTISSFYSRYDDHGNEIVGSYVETEAGTPIDQRDALGGKNNGRVEDESNRYLDVSEDDCVSLTSYGETPVSARPPSAAYELSTEAENGWTTMSEFSGPDSDGGSSAIQRPESPTTPRQPIEAESSPLPPTPPPKDIPPPPPKKDKPKSISPTASSLYSAPAASTYRQSPAFLPEIPTDTEPLGLAIQALPAHYDFRPSLDRSSSYNSEHYYSRQSLDQRPSLESRSSMDQRPSLEQYSPNRPSMEHKYSPSSSFSDSRRSSNYIPNGQRYSETPATSMAPTIEKRGSSSIHSVEPKDTPEMKRLRKRQHLLKEIVDTESAYFRDMTVAEEIYKGSANACYAITAEDVKVLFGNTDAVVQFSKGFLEVLKLAVSSVYVMRRGPSGLNSSAASMVGSVNSDERLDEATDDEKDRKTYVGEAFAEVLFKMEKVYADYCKNHSDAAARLQRLQTIPGIAIWLQECKACAEDLTNAWNLESLLIKPVQRVLKYPLLLKDLLSCTPTDHPDFSALQIACKEMNFVAGRINEVKRRKDMVQSIVGRKRNETDIRHGISKGFQRRAEKLKQSVGLSDIVVDETYNKLLENYNMHCAQVEVIARDIEIYVQEIHTHVDRFIMFSTAIKDFGNAVPTRHAQMEARWATFDNTMRAIANTYLQEHVSCSRSIRITYADCLSETPGQASRHRAFNGSDEAA